MININTALAIHEILIEDFGGGKGVRDNNLLESALARPFQTFDGLDLYPSIYLKAAAILESILINHPFVDGNKRTAFVLMNVLLMESGIVLKVSEVESYDFIINVINERLTIEVISAWIEQKCGTHE